MLPALSLIWDFEWQARPTRRVEKGRRFQPTHLQQPLVTIDIGIRDLYTPLQQCRLRRSVALSVHLLLQHLDEAHVVRKSSRAALPQSAQMNSFNPKPHKHRSGNRRLPQDTLDCRPHRLNHLSSSALHLPPHLVQGLQTLRLKATMEALHPRPAVSLLEVKLHGKKIKSALLTIVDSSPIHYASSSSPGRARHAQNTDIRSSSSALFVRGPESAARNRRSDLHSDILGSSSASRRRRLFVDQNGVVGPEISDAPTFSNLDPGTSDAEALGGNSSRFVWGTNISIPDAKYAFKDFLMNFQRKYRLIQDGELEEGMNLPADHPAMAREYVEMMKMMLELSITPLNLDARNLKAYPPTRKLWHQMQAFPAEIVPLMDSTVKDLMYELAEKKMAEMRVQLSQQRGAPPARGRDSSSLPPMLSSDAPTPGAPSPAPFPEIPNLTHEVEQNVYTVRPFGLDNTINLRELNPADMDKLVSVKGLVIRTTPIIPDLKDGT